MLNEMRSKLRTKLENEMVDAMGVLIDIILNEYPDTDERCTVARGIAAEFNINLGES